MYPEWDAEHPVHLVGHSMGGLTARALVQMLSDDGRSRGEDNLFSRCGGEPGPGEGAAFVRQRDFAVSASWVRSVSTAA
jgi:surfactin synthase thioesterase subunit